MKRADTLTSLILLGVALVGIVWMIPRESVPGEPGEIAPADLPTIALWVIALCAVWQLVAAWRRDDGEPNPFDRFALLFTVAATAGLFALLSGIWWLGYIAGGVLCILAVGAVMRPEKKTWLWLAVVAVVLPIGVYYLSWHGLRLSLP